MADKAIGELPQAPSVNDNSLLAVEQQGTAMKMTGAQFRQFAQASVVQYVASAKQAAQTAQNAIGDAEAAADRAETARDSIVLDEEKMAQAVANAANSAGLAESIVKDAENRVIAAGEAQISAATEQANLAIQSATESADSALLSESWAVGGTESRIGEDANNSKYWASIAQAEADRATVPPVENVYNLIIPDRTTGQKYALLVENGILVILGVADNFVDSQYTLIDTITGLSYVLVADNGKLSIEEV